MTDLSIDDAKNFFGSLYSEKGAPGLDDFDTAAIRLVGRFKQYVMPGDDALRLLMMNHIVGSPKINENDQVELTAAVLGNIKRRAVAMFAEKFPNKNLDELIQAAQQAGYEVDILDEEESRNVPWTTVNR